MRATFCSVVSINIHFRISTNFALKCLFFVVAFVLGK